MTFLCCTGPLSQEEENSRKAKHISRLIGRQLKKSYKNESKCLKLLLLGTGESGKSTVLKQMKIIHINGYTVREKLEFVLPVHKNIHDAMLSLLGGMRLLGEEFQNPENAVLAQQLLDGSIAEPHGYSQAFFDTVEQLWKDQNIQKVFAKANEYQLLDSAKYFLDRIPFIRAKDYIPSDQDILRCRTMTDGVNEVCFSINTGQKNAVTFRVFDVSGQRGARKKWIQLFDNVTAILFLVDTSSFDQMLREDHQQNRLVDSLEVFEQAWSNKYLKSVPMIVFLNKIDVLDEKIRLGRRISRLHSFVANWHDMNEIRRMHVSHSSMNESTGNSESALHESLLSCYSQTSTADVTVFQSTYPHLVSSSPLRKIDENVTVNVAAPTFLTQPMEHSSSNNCSEAKHKRTSPNSTGQWRRNSFTRAFSHLNPSNHSRRFRRSFRQANFIPFSPSQASCGQNSRLSCIATVAKVILESPYHRFYPSAKEQKEFQRSIQYIEHNTSVLNGEDGLLELRPPHPETIRTACYIKHLLNNLTKVPVLPKSEQTMRRQCLFYYTCAVDTDSIRNVLEGCHRFLLEDHLERYGLL
ncbi:unnamed protein product [Dicrocoelium dendriticum]|nr:unnamed protein product [Dicrocoelium dendriticum]